MKRRTTLILTGMALLGVAAIGKPAFAQQNQRVIVQTRAHPAHVYTYPA